MNTQTEPVPTSCLSSEQQRVLIEKAATMQ